MRRFFLAVLLLVPAISVAAENVDPKEIELSKGMAMTVARGEQYAAAVLSIHFKRFSSDDGESVDFAELADIARRYTTIARADKVAAYLSADMDWDGNVTRSELETYLSGQDPRYVEGYLRDGDLDDDGTISLNEMIEDARTEQQDTGKPDSVDMNEMLAWDLNQDGVLEWREVLEVIAAKQ